MLKAIDRMNVIYKVREKTVKINILAKQEESQYKRRDQFLLASVGEVKNQDTFNWESMHKKREFIEGWFSSKYTIKIIDWSWFIENKRVERNIEKCMKEGAQIS